jgi:hypothetical protein
VEKPSFLTLARGGVGGSARHRDSTTVAAIHTMTTSQIERRSMLMAVSDAFLGLGFRLIVPIIEVDQTRFPRCDGGTSRGHGTW